MAKVQSYIVSYQEQQIEDHEDYTVSTFTLELSNPPQRYRFTASTFDELRDKATRLCPAAGSWIVSVKHEGARKPAGFDKAFPHGGFDIIRAA